MNCSETTTTRGGRYPEYTSSSEGWCATTEDYYNENYLPNDSHLATVSGGVPPQGAQYNSYYEYHHPPPPHQNMNPSSTGASSPPLNHQHHPAPPLSHQVSSFPQKRSPSEQDISYNNNYEPKSPSGGTSPWNNFHSFYTKNPASPTSNSIGESPASPQPSGGGNVLSGNDNSNNCGTVILGPQKFGRPSVKRRTTANKKERRRTQSINNAFADLRDCIPNVPADTKLSKIFQQFYNFPLSNLTNQWNYIFLIVTKVNMQFYSISC